MQDVDLIRVARDAPGNELRTSLTETNDGPDDAQKPDEQRTIQGSALPGFGGKSQARPSSRRTKARKVETKPQRGLLPQIASEHVEQ